MELIDFPPFYTLQLNPSTRAKQLDAWISVLRETHPGFIINVADREPVFLNSKINRELSFDAQIVLCNYIRDQGLGEWISENSKFLFYKKSPSDWGIAIHSWADKTGKLNSIESAFSIIHGDDSKGEIFHGIPNEIALRGFKALEAKAKCELTFRETSDIMTCGVKFFP
jgi:ESCRT-II complex subunit VPS25